MCLTKQETKKVTAGYVSIMIVLLVQLGSGLWWASDMNRRVIDLEEEARLGDRFTQSEGDIHSFQITQTLEVVSKIRVTLDRINSQLEQGRIFDKTHRHEEYKGFSPSM